MNIFVTGATGFVGRFLCERLLADGLQVRGTLLPESPLSLVEGVDPVIIQPLGPDTSWIDSLEGIETVIHLAARVHIMPDPSTDPLSEFRRVNVEGTAQLAREAAKAGVKRFVFISSIKVNGEESFIPYTPDSAPKPSDPYGISKWEAEQALRRIEAETGLEVVVVRPTIVYGPGVKANFLNMMRIITKGIPLPLASINNKRSLIYVGNLVDALTICAAHPAAAGQTYLVSDGEDVSTPELIRRVAHALKVPARQFSFPTSLMRMAGKILDGNFKFRILNFGLFKSKIEKPIQNLEFKTHNRFTGAVNRLTGSLTVDSSKIRRELGWVPPFSMDEGLAETAGWFKNK